VADRQLPPRRNTAARWLIPLPIADRSPPEPIDRKRLRGPDLVKFLRQPRSLRPDAQPV